MKLINKQDIELYTHLNEAVRCTLGWDQRLELLCMIQYTNQGSIGIYSHYRTENRDRIANEFIEANGIEVTNITALSV